MALNPPISPVGVPLRVDQEFFVLYRNDMECEVKIQNMGKFSAVGKVHNNLNKIYLTTCRIVFVNDKFDKNSFKSFDFPLAYLTREKFEQPIFGSNYLEGDVDPLYNLLPGKTHFKLWFKSGGCDRFLRLLVDILKQIRRNRQSGNMVPDPRMMENFARTQSQAYMDPNDPSVIYVQQPQLSQQSYGNTTWGIPQNQNKVFPTEQQPPYQQNPPPPVQNYQYNQAPQVGVPVSYPDLNNNQYGQQNQYGQVPPPQYQQQNPYVQQPTQSYNQPPPQQQYQPPPQQYNQPPPPQQYQQPPPQPNTQQPPAQQFNYPPPQSVEQQPNQQEPQNQQPQQQPDQIRNAQPNMAYYYGFWGPQLNSNQNAIL